MNGAVALTAGGQLVLQGGDGGDVVKLPGARDVLDIVFADRYTFWVLVIGEQGKRQLIKYTIAE